VSLELGDPVKLIEIKGWNSIFGSCTFKFIARNGAPGFSLYSFAPANKIMLAYWMEYDLDQITTYANTGTWPAISQTYETVTCDKNSCMQGDYVPRNFTNATGTTLLNPNDILS
jgi:hypothetical protein